VQTQTVNGMRLPSGYELRKGQMQFIEEATEALDAHKVFVGSAPCGIGKSLASLLTVLPRLEDSKLMISFRTRSQLHIFLKELKRLGQNMPAVSFFSKQDMCPLRMTMGGTYFDFLEECRRLKENCENGTKPFCRFYWNMKMMRRRAEELALDCARRLLEPKEAAQRMAKAGFCAYEASKWILGKVKVFLGTYHYMFNPPIRKALLQSWGVDLNEVYLIVDEAHNLPAFARELLSDRITENTVERALKETESFEHKDLKTVQDYLITLEENIFLTLQKQLKSSSLKLLDPRQVAELFMKGSGATVEDAAEVLHEYGEYVREMRQELGQKNIFSYTHRIGEFIENFFKHLEKKYVHLVHRDWGDRVCLEVRSLDGREITDPVLRQAKGSIVMSGFLSPPTVYRDLILNSRESVHLREFDSPFPPENRLILAARDVSSRFEQRTDRMLKKWTDYIETVSAANEGNMGVFFTSYSLMNTILEHLDIDRRLIIEQRKTRRSEVMQKLTASKSNALFGVMGGKFSEGMDYPDNLLTCVVTVGLPYATWSIYQEALIRYFDQQFPGKGRTYAYLTPAIFRLVQACGRVHRSAKDRGCIVMLDERLTHPSIQGLLPSYYRKEMKIVKSPEECGENITEFWARHKFA